jgi:uncharacterized protein (TIGR00369 family)
MSFWTALLDGMVAGTNTSPPPMVRTLKLPPINRWEPGRTWAEWKVDPAFFHERGAVFGGYLAALADSALALVTMTVLEEGEQISTSDLRVSYFRPVTGGTLQIEANVIHRGRRQISVEVVFKREDGKLAAKATATQVII